MLFEQQGDLLVGGAALAGTGDGAAVGFAVAGARHQFGRCSRNHETFVTKKEEERRWVHHAQRPVNLKGIPSEINLESQRRHDLKGVAGLAEPLESNHITNAGLETLALLAAVMVAGVFEYNLGDSEVLMLALLLTSLPFARRRERAGIPVSFYGGTRHVDPRTGNLL